MIATTVVNWLRFYTYTQAYQRENIAVVDADFYLEFPSVLYDYPVEFKNFYYYSVLVTASGHS